MAWGIVCSNTRAICLKKRIFFVLMNSIFRDQIEVDVVLNSVSGVAFADSLKCIFIAIHLCQKNENRYVLNGSCPSLSNKEITIYFYMTKN